MSCNLDVLGREGWELIEISNVGHYCELIFKRPILRGEEEPIGKVHIKQPTENIPIITGFNEETYEIKNIEDIRKNGEILIQPDQEFPNLRK